MYLYAILFATLLALAGCETAVSDAAVRSDGPSVTPKDDNAEGQPVLKVDRFELVAGTRVLAAPVQFEANRGSRISYDEKWAGGTVNHVFYHLDTRAHRRLLPSLDQRILGTRPVFTALDTLATSPGEPSTPKPVRAFLYRVVTADTNDDDRLDAEDQATLAASAPDGTNYTVLADAVERIRNVRRIDDGRVLVVYTHDDQVYGLELDVDKLDVLHRVDFSTPPTPSL